ncbi:MAG TPA: aminopeptidase P N-terminal domain-containing protein [Aggregatilinea sp.]|uniref:aminopeptidase P N-terminal domain-containing protein n=1 Tax=Aggregatilinea sp. TaxID=2806333 RepID=UPI002C894F0E|nr:aminopeptidase P N-terminal domain-containing protein [Aggregatilinea sp.]HML21160.1 aminopeptidase P N-terminal domain-containing protein [Aggregatilinea sp.]
MASQEEWTARYIARRRALLDRIGSGLILIDSSGLSPDPSLYDRNLRYLTGLADRNAYLLLAPQGIMVERLETRTGPELMRGRRVHEILFVAEPGAREAFMDGVSVSLDAIREQTGVDRVYDLGQLEPMLAVVLMDQDTLWLNSPYAPRLNEPLTSYLSLIERIRQRFYWVQLKNIASQIHQMRFVKDALEVECLRRAFEIHTEVFESIMRALKPGTTEALGQAIFDYEVCVRGEPVTSMGSEHYASSVIVGSGPNAAIPHYMANQRVIQDGDLVLIDSGVSYNGYSSDITRTFPANGRFTPRQRALYAVVLEALYAAIDTMKPGSTMLEAHQAVYDTLKRYDLAQYSYGNCGHPVGLSIHDPNGRYADDREQPFEPGVVVVIEPFILLPDEGIGIRIEDGVLITDSGHEILAGPAREIDAVEALCRRD